MCECGTYGPAALPVLVYYVNAVERASSPVSPVITNMDSQIFFVSKGPE